MQHHVRQTRVLYAQALAVEGFPLDACIDALERSHDQILLAAEYLVSAYGTASQRRKRRGLADLSAPDPVREKPASPTDGHKEATGGGSASKQAKTPTRKRATSKKSATTRDTPRTGRRTAPPAAPVPEEVMADGTESSSLSKFEMEALISATEGEQGPLFETAAEDQTHHLMQRLDCTMQAAHTDLSRENVSTWSKELRSSVGCGLDACLVLLRLWKREGTAVSSRKETTLETCYNLLHKFLYQHLLPGWDPGFADSSGQAPSSSSSKQRGKGGVAWMRSLKELVVTSMEIFRAMAGVVSVVVLPDPTLFQWGGDAVTVLSTEVTASAAGPPGRHARSQCADLQRAALELLTTLARRNPGLRDSLTTDALSSLVRLAGLRGKAPRSFTVTACQSLESAAAAAAWDSEEPETPTRAERPWTPAAADRARQARAAQSIMASSSAGSKGQKDAAMLSGSGSDSPAILMATATLLALIHASSAGEDQDEGDRQKRDPSEATTLRIAEKLVERAIRKDEEVDFRALLRQVLEDCLQVLGQPEWPAAEMLVRGLTSGMVRVLRGSTHKQLGKASADLRPLAVELLGLVVSRVRQLSDWLRSQGPVPIPPPANDAQGPCASDSDVWRKLRADVNNSRRVLLGEADMPNDSDDESDNSGIWASSEQRRRILTQQLVLDALEGDLRRDPSDPLSIIRKDAYRFWLSQCMRNTKDAQELIVWTRNRDERQQHPQQLGLEMSLWCSLSLLSATSLFQNRRALLDKLLEAIGEGTAKTKQCSVCAVGNLVAGDPTLMQDPVVAERIQLALRDVAKSVRAAAVNVVGRYIAHAAASSAMAPLRSAAAAHSHSASLETLVDFYFEPLLAMMADTGVRVRNEVLLIMRSLLLTGALPTTASGVARERRHRLLTALLQRASDPEEEASTRRTIEEIFASLWFDLPMHSAVVDDDDDHVPPDSPNRAEPAFRQSAQRRAREVTALENALRARITEMNHIAAQCLRRDGLNASIEWLTSLFSRQWAVCADKGPSTPARRHRGGVEAEALDAGMIVTDLAASVTPSRRSGGSRGASETRQRMIHALVHATVDRLVVLDGLEVRPLQRSVDWLDEGDTRASTPATTTTTTTTATTTNGTTQTLVTQLQELAASEWDRCQHVVRRSRHSHAAAGNQEKDDDAQVAAFWRLEHATATLALLDCWATVEPSILRPYIRQVQSYMLGLAGAGDAGDAVGRNLAVMRAQHAVQHRACTIVARVLPTVAVPDRSLLEGIMKDAEHILLRSCVPTLMRAAAQILGTVVAVSPPSVDSEGLTPSVASMTCPTLRSRALSLLGRLYDHCTAMLERGASIAEGEDAATRRKQWLRDLALLNGGDGHRMTQSALYGMGLLCAAVDFDAPALTNAEGASDLALDADALAEHQSSTYYGDEQPMEGDDEDNGSESDVEDDEDASLGLFHAGEGFVDMGDEAPSIGLGGSQDAPSQHDLPPPAVEALVPGRVLMQVARMLERWIFLPDIKLQCASLRCLGALVEREPRILRGSGAKQLLRDALSSRTALLRQTVLGVMKAWFELHARDVPTTETGRTVAENDQGAQAVRTEAHMAVLGDRNTGASHLMSGLQQHVDAVRSRLFDPDAAVRSAALEVFGRAVHAGMVGPDEASGPLWALQCLVCETNDDTSDHYRRRPQQQQHVARERMTALSLLESVASHHSDIVFHCAIPGIADGILLQRTLLRSWSAVTGVSSTAAGETSALLGPAYDTLLARNTTARDNFLHSLLQRFHPFVGGEGEPSSFRGTNVRRSSGIFRRFAAETLAHLPYSREEEVVRVAAESGQILHVRVPTVLESLEADLRSARNPHHGEDVSDSDSEREQSGSPHRLVHSGSTSAHRGRSAQSYTAAGSPGRSSALGTLRHTTQEAAALSLLGDLRAYLLRVYHISASKCTAAVESAMGRDALRKPSRLGKLDRPVTRDRGAIAFQPSLWFPWLDDGSLPSTDLVRDAGRIRAQLEKLQQQDECELGPTSTAKANGTTTTPRRRRRKSPSKRGRGRGRGAVPRSRGAKRGRGKGRGQPPREESDSSSEDELFLDDGDDDAEEEDDSLDFGDGGGTSPRAAKRRRIVS